MVKIFSAETLHNLAKTAASAPRLRAHLNVHETLDAAVQRLFISTEPDTYIRPHRHSQSNKWEFFTVLEGKMDLLIFNDEGKIIERIRLSRDAIRSIEIPPNVWHSYVCLHSGTLALEIKEGAYVPSTPEELPAWAPAENTIEAKDYLEWMKQA